eukprot:COSAG06_NODE_1158_length_10465_cov_13.338318_12_plen_122_part_00
MPTDPYHSLPDVQPRPPKELWAPLAAFGTATISSALREECGITRGYAFGPRCVLPGQRLLGVAKTIGFLPKREDIEAGMEEEENEKESPLWSGVVRLPSAAPHRTAVLHFSPARSVRSCLN